MTEILTSRLRLRSLTLADLDAVATIWADPEVMRYITGEPRSRQASEARLQRLIDHEVTHGFGIWAAVDAQDQLLGYCGLQYLDNTPEIEVGYGFAKVHWGKGLATEAAIASVSYGFCNLALGRIVAIAHPQNLASRHVIEKLGMQYEKMARFYNTDVVYYGLNRDQWKALNNGSAD
jgi:ribosomal-protein-alanine N-acetyltransferase